MTKSFFFLLLGMIRQNTPSALVKRQRGQAEQTSYYGIAQRRRLGHTEDMYRFVMCAIYFVTAPDSKDTYQRASLRQTTQQEKQH